MFRWPNIFTSSLVTSAASQNRAGHGPTEAQLPLDGMRS